MFRVLRESRESDADVADLRSRLSNRLAVFGAEGLREHFLVLFNDFHKTVQNIRSLRNRCLSPFLLPFDSGSDRQLDVFCRCFRNALNDLAGCRIDYVKGFSTETVYFFSINNHLHCDTLLFRMHDL